MKLLTTLLLAMITKQPVIVVPDSTPTDAENTIVASLEDDVIDYFTPGAIIYLPTEVQEIIQFKKNSYDPSQPHLTKQSGVFYGESGKETYYNLNMNRCISVMRGLGYDEANYPYWIREDGVKMLGDYVMVAADFSIRPRGTLVKTSLGMGIVVDTGTFARYDSTMLDICVTW